MFFQNWYHEIIISNWKTSTNPSENTRLPDVILYFPADLLTFSHWNTSNFVQCMIIVVILCNNSNKVYIKSVRFFQEN